jgi:hypothetical protein
MPEGLNTYQFHNKEYNQEENTIYNNSFPIHPQKPPNYNKTKLRLHQNLLTNGPRLHT